jgi:GNAT superfamily N-acetyltransferase
MLSKKREKVNKSQMERNNLAEYVPVVVPAWIDLGHAVYPVRVVGDGAASVPEGAAATGADADERDEDDDHEHGDLVPVLAHVLHDAGLAGVALVAEDVWGVVPLVAVVVLRRHGHASAVLAGCWWLAATRLQSSNLVLEQRHRAVGLGTQLVRFLLVELIHLYLNHIFDINVIFIFNYSFNGRRRCMMINFMNLKIKSARSFKDVHRDRIHVHIFIK